MAVTFSKPKKPAPTPWMKTRVKRPYAAPTDRRFNRMDTMAITSDRKAINNRMKLRPSTNSSTYGVGADTALK